MTPVVLPVRHVQQTEDGQCVPLCALMALDYLGFKVGYEQVSQLLGTQQFGTVVSRVRNLESLGVTVVYKQGTLTEIYDHLVNNRPCIAFVKTGNLPYWSQDIDHAVLIVGLDDNSIYLNDPELPEAPIAISHGDFDLAWLERDEYYATFLRRD